MELLYVTVVGASLAMILRYVLPKRETYGAALLPAIGAAVTSVVWVGLVWAGWTFDGGWIWVASLGAAVVVALLTALLIPGRRAQADVALFDNLAGVKA
jgi:hypothetical protein